MVATLRGSTVVTVYYTRTYAYSKHLFQEMEPRPCPVSCRADRLKDETTPRLHVVVEGGSSSQQQLDQQQL